MIELENATGAIQKVYDEAGTLYSMGPFATKAWKDDVAQLFLSQRASYVRVVHEGEIPRVLMNERVMWIANMTGCPFYPREFEITVIEKDLPVLKKIPNKNAVAQKLKWTINVGQGDDPYGRVPEIITSSPARDFNLPPIQLTLRVRQRVPVGHKIGQFIMQRDALEGDMGHGQVMECRPPTSFEPTMQWDLPKIIFYARMVCDSDFERDYIVERFKVNNPDKHSRGEPALVDVMGNPAWCEGVKDDLLARLFYRIVDPAYGLPTEVAFTRHFEESMNAHKEKKAMPRSPIARPEKPVPVVAPKPVAVDTPVPAPDPLALAKMATIVSEGLGIDLEPKAEKEETPAA